MCSRGITLLLLRRRRRPPKIRRGRETVGERDDVVTAAYPVGERRLSGTRSKRIDRNDAPQQYNSNGIEDVRHLPRGSRS